MSFQLAPNTFWPTELISQFFCYLNSLKNITCPSGKPLAQQQNPLAPGLSNTTFFARCELSVFPSFLVSEVKNESFSCTHNLGEQTRQVWRDNSCHVRTQVKKLQRCSLCRLGLIIQSIFCAQSGASIRLTIWKWSSGSQYPGALPPELKNFHRTFSPTPTDCPWVSEDELGTVWIYKYIINYSFFIKVYIIEL